MDKTLDALQLVHRLVMALTLAMIVLGFSIQRPSGKYATAGDELDYLRQVLKSMAEHRETVYSALYERSELRSSILAWLSNKKSKQRTIAVSTIDPDGIAVPNPDHDSRVTVEQQVRSVDNVFSNLYLPFIVCTANRQDIFAALDKAFAGRVPGIESVVVKVRSRDGNVGAISGPWICSLAITSLRAEGTVHATDSTELGISTQALEVQDQYVGPKKVDLDSAGWLKRHGFGDYEASRIAPVFAIRELWSDIRTQDVSSVSAFLIRQQLVEEKQAEQKIEILGQPLNGAISTMLSSLLTLAALMYLTTLATHARGIAAGNELVVKESPFLGLLNHWTGRIIIVCTVFVLPLAATAFDLIVVFPRFRDQWSGPHWLASSTSRWICTGGVALLGMLAFAILTSTVAEVKRTVIVSEPYE